MWEFLSRKKEVSAAPASEAAPVTHPETVPAAVEQVAERGSESANEKYAAILTQSGSAGQPTAQSTDDDVHADAQVVGSAVDAASRVTQLVELAQVKGVAHAVEVARKMNDLYVLDTMHDELADKLYDALKAKGLIRGE
ncbi:MAG: hypothetical protein E6Q06_02910 [Candidatus Moraniibacteriota bacterium]|nr:MAG: hypothetical protein E6Q06_02910 [Candidatus Moranbacteria bacterium]